MNSVLEKEYKKPIRPYSKLELNEILQKNRKRLRLSETYMFHKKCGHLYLARTGGKKLKQFNEGGMRGLNCSVCWKFKKTPSEIKHIAEDMIEYYIIHYNDSLSYETVELERDFHYWLYCEFNVVEAPSNEIVLEE